MAPGLAYHPTDDPGQDMASPKPPWAGHGPIKSTMGAGMLTALGGGPMGNNVPKRPYDVEWIVLKSVSVGPSHADMPLEAMIVEVTVGMTFGNIAEEGQVSQTATLMMTGVDAEGFPVGARFGFNRR